jgi:hypothetical protein
VRASTELRELRGALSPRSSGAWVSMQACGTASSTIQRWTIRCNWPSTLP